MPIKTSNLKEIYQELCKTIKSDEAEKEAQIVLETILNIDKSEFIIDGDLRLTRNQCKTILEIRDRRNKEKIPLAYLLEEAHFMDLKLFVNSDVLIPRPETELLVELVLDEIKNRKIHHPNILDLGTGSGCIAIALKLALPAAKVYAADISSAALSVTAINAKRYNADVEMVLGDYLDPFLSISSSPVAVPIFKTPPPYFDVIVSNPPYISKEDYEKLSPELFHEPKHALVGFPYLHIKNQAKTLLKENGFLAFEFGLSQEEKLAEIFPEADFYKDYANIDRMLVWDYMRESRL